MNLLRLRAVKSFIERAVIPLGDIVLAPVVLLAAGLLKLVRRVGVYRMRLSRAILMKVGVFPIRDHYYEPMFNPRHLHRPLDAERPLPGIDFDLPAQLEFISKFDYAAELDAIPRSGADDAYHYANPNFSCGDSEFLYSVIRRLRPARILEIGSGFSTRMMLLAIAKNRSEDPAYACTVTCVEPYEMPWLDGTPGIQVLRRTVESIDAKLVTGLKANDILFIDSSHVVRPQGDVLREVLELLPLLAPGVLVHIHDIFTPRDYPALWVVDEVRLYTEQYLVEAFLSHNTRFGVIGALNLLAHRHPDRLAEKFPVFREQGAARPPSSLWLISR